MLFMKDSNPLDPISEIPYVLDVNRTSTTTINTTAHFTCNQVFIRDTSCSVVLPPEALQYKHCRCGVNIFVVVSWNLKFEI
jgi:hypothetical protein